MKWRFFRLLKQLFRECLQYFSEIYDHPEIIDIDSLLPEAASGARATAPPFSFSLFFPEDISDAVAKNIAITD